MVEATDFANRDDLAEFRPLNWAAVGRILVEREVSTRLVIVREVAGQEAAQVPFAKDEDVIQALAPDGADEPLREGVLPWAVRRREDFTDAHALHALPEHVTVDRVAIAEEIGRGGVVREGVHDLLGRPGSGGMLGDIEMEDAPAVVGEHDEDEQNAQARGGNSEEIDGDEVSDVIGQERAPRLRRRRAALREQTRDGALSNVDAELEEFAMDSGSTPQGIGRGHSSDQGFDRGVDGRVARRAAPGERGPVATKAASLPAQHSGGSHDDEGLPPGGPDSGQPDPKEPIAPLKLQPVRRPLVDGQLLPQGEVLQGELAVAAAQEREESEQMEQEDDHRARIVSGSEPTDQPLAHRTEFWRRTGRLSVCRRAARTRLSSTLITAHKPRGYERRRITSADHSLMYLSRAASNSAMTSGGTPAARSLA